MIASLGVAHCRRVAKEGARSKATSFIPRTYGCIRVCQGHISLAFSLLSKHLDDRGIVVSKHWLVMASLYLAPGVFGVALPVAIAVSERANQPSELIPLHFTVSPLWKSYGTDA